MTGAAFLDWKTRTPSWGAQPLDTPEAIPKRHFQLTPSSLVRTWPARSASIGGCDLRHAAVVAQKGGTNTGCENKPHASSIRRVQERKSAKFPLGWRRRRTTGKSFSKHPVVPQVQVPESLGGAWQAYYRCGTDLSIAVGSLRS